MHNIYIVILAPLAIGNSPVIETLLLSETPPSSTSSSRPVPSELTR